MECEHCETVLKSEYNLRVHQTTAGYCLKIQGINNANDEELKCGKCSKILSTKTNLTKHEKICQKNIGSKKDMADIIQEKDIEIRILKQKVENTERERDLWKDQHEKLTQTLASRSTTTKNTMINNNTLNLSVFNKTAEQIKDIVNEKYNREYLLEGQKGVARFTYSHIIKPEEGQPPMYLITDKSRGNAKYKVSETEVVTDNSMIGLSKKIYPSVKQKAVEISLREENPFDGGPFNRGMNELVEMSQDNSVFRNELMKLSE